MEKEIKDYREKACDIYGEIATINRAFDEMSDTENLYYYAQFFYNRTNMLIQELKKILSKLKDWSLSDGQKEHISNIKSKLWCACSDEFRYEVGKNFKEFTAID